MTWDWHFVGQILPSLLGGLWLTVVATLGASLIVFPLGLLLALARRSPRAAVRTSVVTVSELVRRTPLLIQLYFIFYVLPSAGLLLPALVCGIVGLGVHYATYAAQIFRGGIDNVGRGQWDAATALSLPRHRIWRTIVLPQALPGIYPALGNLVIAMFKETALFSAITVQELLGRAREIGIDNFDYLEPLVLAGCLYFAVSYPASAAIRRLERRSARRPA
jgi:polar amino acid transport system permease protein